jgi:putative Mg2+ transporter-C (MgtC) family protein
MDEFWKEVLRDLPAMPELLIVGFRLCLAALLGALPGLQRERHGQAAGLRTHMMVAVGAAIFVMAALEAGATVGDTTRVIQGLATGIGFVGAGAILKSKEDLEIRGLTTAASVWLTAGVGTAVGLGRIWLPVLGTILAVIILSVLRWVGDVIGSPPGSPRGPDETAHR